MDIDLEISAHLTNRWSLNSIFYNHKDDQYIEAVISNLFCIRIYLTGQEPYGVQLGLRPGSHFSGPVEDRDRGYACIRNYRLADPSEVMGTIDMALNGLELELKKGYKHLCAQ